MKPWKVNQEIYHRVNSDFEDDLSQQDLNVVQIDSYIIGSAIKHFNEKIDTWEYPAKSYFVGICYAYWIAEEFLEDFYEVLNDRDLLFGNDPFFVPYMEDQIIYDEIISAVGLPIPNTGMVPDVREYYEKEILLKNNSFDDV